MAAGRLGLDAFDRSACSYSNLRLFMARLLGPKHHICRRMGERLCDSAKCPVMRRPTPPGVHGPKGYGRQTEYGTQLREKQKVKYVYGIMERQFRRYYEEALRRPGNTAELFLQRLERRLDNVVYRLGFARSRAEARQMVNHGWVCVNGKRLTIPSYLTKQGDTISLKPSAKGTTRFKEIIQQRQIQNMSQSRWLTSNTEALEGKMLALPTQDDFPRNVNMTLVVEFYSR